MQLQFIDQDLEQCWLIVIEGAEVQGELFIRSKRSLRVTGQMEGDGDSLSDRPLILLFCLPQ